jgi:integrase
VSRPDLLTAVLALVPREDRQPDGRVFAGVTQAPLRTDLGRACKAAGVPRFNLHDLRHRRISLWVRRACHWPMSAPGPGTPG